jgi:tetratricopeptide (TPR) repeat protein
MGSQLARPASREAESAARQALRLSPSNAQAWSRLGTILHQQSALAEAARCFETAFSLDASFFEALNNLAVTLQRMGDHAAAEARYRQALLLRPQSTGVEFNLAVLLGHTGRYAEALEIAGRLLVREPKMIPAYLLASALEGETGRHAAALARVRQALAIAPGDTGILLRQAEVLLQTGDYATALKVCDQILAKDPANSKTLHIRALALQGLDLCPEALQAFEQAEAASPATASIMASHAWLLAEMGRKPEAITMIDQALARDPGDVKSWYEKASLTRFKADDPALTAMARLADRPGTAYPDRIKLCFALGKATLDLGDGAQAFARLDEGNRLKRAILDYEPDADARHIRDIAQAFPAETLARLHGTGPASNQPVFIFGMPRSGTTLLEQILASHPHVHGMGEPPYLTSLAGAPGFLESVAALTPGAAALLGQRYLASSSPAGHGRPRLVDKTPSNFLHAGLISVILPGAKMIHCRRDPLDTCMSCYSLLFASGYQYSYDLAELGAYYRLYLELMAHWRRVLAPDRFLEIDYESLTRDGGEEVRKILDFLELPWDAACLRSHETKRRVTSASLDQVRAPVYQTSIGRARAFLPWLGRLGTFS